MQGNIWVIAEWWRGDISEATYEMLALARELADAGGVQCEVIVLGSQDAAAGQLAAADRVIAVDGEGLDPAIGGSAAAALASIMEDRSPGAVLIPITNVSWDLIGLLPALSGAPLVNLCSDLALVDGALQARSSLYGGKMEATVAVPDRSVIVAVLPGIRAADAGRVAGEVAVEAVTVEPIPQSGVRLIEYIDPEPGDVDITKQDVLIGIGRGIDGEANVEMAVELADVLGGVVCGSRPAIDQGWLPISAQVGKSGQKVTPKLYVALGISGAPEHLEGMRDADLIIAVNTDPDAPIFGAAHYGITHDLFDVTPELIDRCTEIKGG